MSSNSNTQSASGGIGVAGLLGVAFVILRLIHKIDWPWIWVVSPFWIPLAIFLAVLVVILAVAGIAALAKGGSHR